MGWGSFVSSVKKAVKKAATPVKKVAEAHKTIATKSVDVHKMAASKAKGAHVMIAHKGFDRVRNMNAQRFDRLQKFAANAPTQLPHTRLPVSVPHGPALIPGKTGMKHAKAAGFENNFGPIQRRVEKPFRRRRV